MKKKITPKLMINNTLIQKPEQILNYYLSLDLYNEYKSSNLVLWLFRKNFISHESFDKYKTPNEDIFFYLQFLKKVFVGYDIDFNKVEKEYKNILNEFIINQNKSNIEIQEFIKEILNYEIFINDNLFEKRDEKIYLKFLDTNIFPKINYYIKNSGDRISNSFRNKWNNLVSKG